MPKALIVEIFANAKQFGEELERAAGKTRRFSKAAGVAGLAVAGGLAYGLEKSVVSAAKFQSNMELLSTQAGASQKQVAGLSASVLTLAGPTATAPNELAAGMYHLVSQGLKPGKQAMDALRIAAEGATIGHANLEDVTNALGAVIAGKLVKGANGVQQAMGAMNAVVGAGDMRMQDLADAMGTGLPAKAQSAKVSLQDVGAALAVFGDNNIRGAQAGTLLNSTMRLMEGPSKAAATAMKKYGLEALGATLRNKGLVPSIELMQDKLKGLSGHARFEAVTQMFGGKQAGGVMILLNQLDRLKKKEEEVGAGALGFKSAWTHTTQTTEFKFKSLKSSLSAVGINIGTMLLPAITKMGTKLASATQWLSQHKAVTKLLVIAIAGLAGMLIAVSIATKVANAAQAIWNTGKKIGIALSKLFTTTTEESTAATEGQTIATEAQSFAAKAAAAAQWLFNAAMDASPIILVIAAVAALGVAAYEIIHHWGAVKSFFISLWHGIKGAFSASIDWIKGHWKMFLGLPGLVWQEWGPISNFFSGLWDGIKGVFNTGVTWIKGHWKIFLGLPGLVWQYWGTITGQFSKLWDTITGIFSSGLGVVKGMWNSAISWLTELVRPLVDAYNAVAGWATGNISLPHSSGGGSSSSRGPSGPGGPAGHPGHWRGAVVGPSPHLAWVGEGVREAIIPLHGPNKAHALAQAISHGLFDGMTVSGGHAGGGHGTMVAEIPIEIPLMDGRVLRAQRSVTLRQHARGNLWGGV